MRLKFHPVCYFHVFILGMLLAKLRQLLDKQAVRSRHGADSWRNPYVIALQFVAPLGASARQDLGHFAEVIWS